MESAFRNHIDSELEDSKHDQLHLNQVIKDDSSYISSTKGMIAFSKTKISS